MHRALLIPEIVACIVENGASSPGFLFNSLLVNKLFFEEAARICWYGCGSNYNTATAGHVAPDIRHLGKIAAQDLGRAQTYANLVHILMFAHDADVIYEPGCPPKCALSEIRWHEWLKQLQFPQLEEVTFWNIQFALPSEYTEDTILCYAQPNVTAFMVYSVLDLSDAFLDVLSERCGRLKSLVLYGIKYGHISSTGLRQFLSRQPAFKYLNIPELSPHLDSIAIRTVSQYQHLEVLSLRMEKEELLENIDSGFRRLRSLTTTMTAAGVEQLHRLAPPLTHLRLNILPPCNHILALVSKFSQLRDLTLNLSPRCVVDGGQLELLGQGCPNLTQLTISDSRANHGRVKAVQITDEAIESFAKKTPHLTSLKLLLEDPENTLASLFSLGKSCPDLKNLVLSCNTDWASLAVHEVPKDLFLKLESLHIFPNSHDLIEWEGGDELVTKVANKLADCMPRLSNFGAEPGGRLDEKLGEFMDEICIERL